MNLSDYVIQYIIFSILMGATYTFLSSGGKRRSRLAVCRCFISMMIIWPMFTIWGIVEIFRDLFGMGDGGFKEGEDDDI